jgi:hypothetical protein
MLKRKFSKAKQLENRKKIRIDISLKRTNRWQIST